VSLAFNRFGSSQPFGLGAFDLPDEFDAALERLAGREAVALPGGQRPVERVALPGQPRDLLLGAAHLLAQRFELAAPLSGEPPCLTPAIAAVRFFPLLCFAAFEYEPPVVLKVPVERPHGPISD